MRDYLERFDKEYFPLLGARAPTMRAIIREAQHRQAMFTVETGSIRKEGNWAGDGQSTIILSDFMNDRHGSFTTIDIDPEATSLARKLVPSASCGCVDSVVWLSQCKAAIDFLYLDSFDLDQDNVHPAALHCMMEFCAARPRLHSGSIVAVDDSPVESDWSITGKGMYVAQYMRQLGIRPFTFGYQVAWVLP